MFDPTRNGGFMPERSSTPHSPVGVSTNTGIKHAGNVAHEIVVVRWSDPLVQRIGHDALGTYVEIFWLGILGPTATWLLRRLAVVAVAHPDGHRLDARDTATALGLGGDVGRAAAFNRALQRLVMFGLARHVDGAIAIRTVVPPLSMRHLSRLPERLQSAHALWNDDDEHAGLAMAFGFDADAGVNVVAS